MQSARKQTDYHIHISTEPTAFLFIAQNEMVPNSKRSLILLNSLSEFVEAVLKDFDDQSLFSQFSVN